MFAFLLTASPFPCTSILPHNVWSRFRVERLHCVGISFSVLSFLNSTLSNIAPCLSFLVLHIHIHIHPLPCPIFGLVH
jgi:hypothetical protein